MAYEGGIDDPIEVDDDAGDVDADDDAGDDAPLQVLAREESNTRMNNIIRGVGNDYEMELLEGGKRLSNADKAKITPNQSEKGNFSKWFSRVSRYFEDKGRRLKYEIAKRFFEEGIKYERIPNDEGAEQADRNYQELIEEERRQEVLDREESQKEAWENLKAYFPKMKKGNPPFTARVDEFGRTVLKLGKSNAKEWDINDYGKKGFPKTISDYLGKKVEEVVDGIENDVTEKEREKERLSKVALDDNEDAETRADAVKKAMIIDDEIERLEWEKEKLERNTSTRYKVSRIFKKYGFTVAAIVSSIGIIIGAVVSNLKSGLGKVAKGMGNGLKELGKKLGQVLPGIAGAIASFIFKTAGEALGFLAKNAWLLIVAVVLYAVDKLKGKK